MLDLLLHIFNIIYVVLIVFVFFFCAFGGLIVRYLGYRSLEFRDTHHTSEKHEIQYSVWRLKKEVAEFSTALTTDFWVRFGSGDHPNVNFLIEKPHPFYKYSLLENVLAFLAFKQKREYGVYYDILDDEGSRYAGHSREAKELLDSDLDDIQCTFVQYTKCYLEELEEISDKYSPFAAEVRSIMTGKYMKDMEEEMKGEDMETGE